MVNWLVFLFRILDMLHVKTEIKKYQSVVFFIQLLDHVRIPPCCSILTSAWKKMLLILLCLFVLNSRARVFILKTYIHAIKVFKL